MKNISLDTGRKTQKKKTRQKLLETTQKLLSTGKSFTLEDVAKHSKTSRATVYRYFSNIDILCSEAGIDINTKSPESLVEACKDLPIIDQILFIQDYYNRLSINNEAAFRKYLSVYLKEDFSVSKKSVRGARRTATLKLALQPYKSQLGENYQNIIASATALMGIEPMITAKDVCKLNNTQAQKSLSWALKTLLQNCGLKN
ncbi:TetR/AcrR family transcriptional regulator [Hanstruepera flava]|uniref:TetR/AcrR family transcriptional regulator n=1 Tax=Hanstruepera flava TaxID=2930218 RepID=UPI002027A6F9|nr:TetR family transcriptional regulator [Hanstruepera flava]